MQLRNLAFLRNRSEVAKLLWTGLLSQPTMRRPRQGQRGSGAQPSPAVVGCQGQLPRARTLDERKRSGIKKDSKDHSSFMLFCNGVPVTSSRCAEV